MKLSFGEILLLTRCAVLAAQFRGAQREGTPNEGAGHLDGMRKWLCLEKELSQQAFGILSQPCKETVLQVHSTRAKIRTMAKGPRGWLSPLGV